MVQIVDRIPDTIRVAFEKTGDLQYISHLDLVRTMNKILVRAGVPLKYSEGFNPKPKMVFASPLSIGVESICELMDVKIAGEVYLQKIKASLERNVSDGMKINDVYIPSSKFSDIKYMSYLIELTTHDPDRSAKQISELFSRPSVEVIKRTKNGDAPYNVKNSLYKYTVGVANGVIKIEMMLFSDTSSFLNPEYIIKAIRENTDALSPDSPLTEYYSIMRTGMYRSDLTVFR